MTSINNDNTKKQEELFQQKVNNINNLLSANHNLQRHLSLIKSQSSSEFKNLSNVNNENQYYRKNSSKNFTLNSKTNNDAIPFNNKIQDFTMKTVNSKNSIENCFPNKSQKNFRNYTYFFQRNTTKKLNSHKLVTTNMMGESSNKSNKKTVILENNANLLFPTYSSRFLERKKKVYDSNSDEEIEEEDDLNNIDYLSYGIRNDSIYKLVFDTVIFLNIICSIFYTFLSISLFDLTNTNDLRQMMIFWFLFDFINMIDFTLGFFWTYLDKNEKHVYCLVSISLNYLKNSFFFNLITSLPFCFIIVSLQYSDYYENEQIYYDKVNHLPLNLKINKNEFLNYNYQLIKINNEIKYLNQEMELEKLLICQKGQYLNNSFIISFIFILRLIKCLEISFDSSFILKSLGRLGELANMSTITKKLITYSLIFIMISHIFCCYWVWLANIQFPNWTINLENELTKVEMYINSAYFVITTIFTVGYGDIIAINYHEKIYIIFLMCFGMALDTLIVSNISNIIKTFQDEDTDKNRILDYFSNAKIQFEIDEELYKKTVSFIEHKYKTIKYSKGLLLNDLPSSVQNELTCIVYADLIRLFKFFKPIKFFDEYDELFVIQPEFAVQVLTKLTPMKFYKNDYLINENDQIEEVILISYGILSLEFDYNNQKYKVIELYKGEHFGEVQMLLNQKAKFSVRVKTKISELFILSKFDLMQISKEFQAIFRQIFKESAYNMLVLEQFINNLKYEIEYNEAWGGQKISQNSITSFTPDNKLEEDEEDEEAEEEEEEEEEEKEQKEDKEKLKISNPLNNNLNQKKKTSLHTLVEVEKENETFIKNNFSSDLDSTGKNKISKVQSQTDLIKLAKSKTQKNVKKSEVVKELLSPLFFINNIKSKSIMNRRHSVFKAQISPFQSVFKVGSGEEANIEIPNKRRNSQFVNLNNIYKSNNLLKVKLGKIEESLKNKFSNNKLNQLKISKNSLNTNKKINKQSKSTLKESNSIFKFQSNKSFKIKEEIIDNKASFESTFINEKENSFSNNRSNNHVSVKSIIDLKSKKSSKFAHSTKNTKKGSKKSFFIKKIQMQNSYIKPNNKKSESELSVSFLNKSYYPTNNIYNNISSFQKELELEKEKLERSLIYDNKEKEKEKEIFKIKDDNKTEKSFKARVHKKHGTINTNKVSYLFQESNIISTIMEEQKKRRRNTNIQYINSFTNNEELGTEKKTLFRKESFLDRLTYKKMEMLNEEEDMEISKPANKEILFIPEANIPKNNSNKNLITAVIEKNPKIKKARDTLKQLVNPNLRIEDINLIKTPFKGKPATVQEKESMSNKKESANRRNLLSKNEIIKNIDRNRIRRDTQFLVKEINFRVENDKNNIYNSKEYYENNFSKWIIDNSKPSSIQFGKNFNINNKNELITTNEIKINKNLKKQKSNSNDLYFLDGNSEGGQSQENSFFNFNRSSSNVNHFKSQEKGISPIKLRKFTDRPFLNK